MFRSLSQNAIFFAVLFSLFIAFLSSCVSETAFLKTNYAVKRLFLRPCPKTNNYNSFRNKKFVCSVICTMVYYLEIGMCIILQNTTNVRSIAIIREPPRLPRTMYM